MRRTTANAPCETRAETPTVLYVRQPSVEMRYTPSFAAWTCSATWGSDGGLWLAETLSLKNL